VRFAAGTTVSYLGEEFYVMKGNGTCPIPSAVVIDRGFEVFEGTHIMALGGCVAILLYRYSLIRFGFLL
jgi:hypothetical protein